MLLSLLVILNKVKDLLLPFPSSPTTLRVPHLRRVFVFAAKVGVTAPYNPNSPFASAKHFTANSNSARVCAAEICVRIRAFPIGTTGYENATTYTPFASIRSATFTATDASPNITGTIGCSPGSKVNPALVISSRKYSVFDRRCSRRSSDPPTSSSTYSEAATIGGATEFENK